MSKMRRQDSDDTEIQQVLPPVSSPKSAIIVEYLQQMALPSMWQRELVEQDYELWDKVLTPYSIAAIRFAFDSYISGGSKFPTVSQIMELASSYAEQESLQNHYKTKREAFGVPPGVLLAILPQIISRAESYHKRHIDPAPPMTEGEIQAMAENLKADPFPFLKRFPNGNPTYNKTLTQARSLMSIR